MKENITDYIIDYILKGFLICSCIETYDNFKMLHDKEINRLQELKNNGIKLISSMGI